jgi:hypothetical protein
MDHHPEGKETLPVLSFFKIPLRKDYGINTIVVSQRFVEELLEPPYVTNGENPFTCPLSPQGRGETY